MLLPSFTRAQRLALLFISVLMLGICAYELTPLKRLKARHTALIEWARSGASGDFAKEFAASNYEDQWGYNPAEVGQQVRAARYAYPHLTIEEEDPRIELAGKAAAIVQAITVRPGDGETRRFTIHCAWVQESFWPWSWKLRKVEAPDLSF